jgi:hypothetical protein
LGLLWLEKHNPTINYKNRIMVFDNCGCRPIRDIDVKEVLVRAMKAYFRQDPDQVYLAMIIVKGGKAFFTVL